jgi:hypothetical protein
MQGIRFGIVTGGAWTLEQTAGCTAKSEILFDRWPIMLLRPDVVEMERARIVILRKLTVFAGSLCSFPNLLA